MRALRELQELERRPRRTARRRCQCGECRNCVEDARWERIYREKFADPYYYDRDWVRFDSPLSTLPSNG
ncbi:MAG: hypothetical protein FJW37_09050 [Acidobacteria bacterium]|nr:hypothetical protein [Acidobacteriota bacterium]